MDVGNKFYSFTYSTEYASKVDDDGTEWITKKGDTRKKLITYRVVGIIRKMAEGHVDIDELDDIIYFVDDEDEDEIIGSMPATYLTNSYFLTAEEALT